MYNNMFIGLINNPSWVFLFDSLVLWVTNYKSNFFIRLKERGKEEERREAMKNKRKRQGRIKERGNEE